MVHLHAATYIRGIPTSDSHRVEVQTHTFALCSDPVVRVRSVQQLHHEVHEKRLSSAVGSCYGYRHDGQIFGEIFPDEVFQSGGVEAKVVGDRVLFQHGDCSFHVYYIQFQLK